jgi:hypothetical protein
LVVVVDIKVGECLPSAKLQNQMTALGQN